MWMTRHIVLALALSVAAPATAQTVIKLPRHYVIAEDPIPQAVLDAVPADTKRGHIFTFRDPADGPGGPCDDYLKGTEIQPVVTAEMRTAGFTDQPYCII
ncbi:MAG TPA: hypothetical protein DEO85_04365 [Maritimibacter sp.]|nr:hypothetical protein [Maritimibacter sp.]